MLLIWVIEIETEKWKIMQIWDLQIVDPKFDDVFWKEIKRWLDNHTKYPSINFDNDRTLNIFWEEFIIVNYNNVSNRSIDKENFEKRFEKRWKYSTKSFEKWRQIPEVSGYFNYNWEYYLILYNYNALTSEETDSVYKWVIVNPWKYFKAENQVIETSEKIKWIL